MSNDVVMLNTLIQRGFEPNSVIDGGASVGDWTKAVNNVLPNAQFLMIEPREWCRIHLERIQSKRIKYIRALLFSSRAEINFYEHGEQSSLLRNYSGKEWGKVSVIETEILNNIAADMPAPILLKLDLQGAELDALYGADEILPKVEVIFMEVSLFEFMNNIPLIHESFVNMGLLGYTVYDIFNKHTRPIDGRVGQFDVCFVAKSSQLVADNRWSNEW